MLTEPLSLYVHIPFCQTRCSYCAFTSQASEHTPEGQIDRYLNALFLEFERAPHDRPLKSIFVGGGTPSLLSTSQMRRLCSTITEMWDRQQPDCEWTVEMNPGSAHIEFIQAAIECGVNRFSVGVQSFSRNTLQGLQREHNPTDILQTMNELRNCGIENVNLDLIYGVPTQTMASFDSDLAQLMELQPEHVSLYNLQFEEGTGLRDRLDQGDVSELHEETQIEMYQHACSQMTAAGLPQYEISNFSSDAGQCQHNLTYWRNKEYIGTGAGAYGFVEGVRYRNHCTIERYISEIEGGQFLRAEEDKLTSDQLLVETLITGLRLREGINWRQLTDQFGYSLTSPLMKTCDEHTNQGLMELMGEGRVRLTTKGILVSNAIFETLVQPC